MTDVSPADDDAPAADSPADDAPTDAPASAGAPVRPVASSTAPAASKQTQPKAAKAMLKFENGKKLECLFNPDKLTITKTNIWNEGGNGDAKDVKTLSFAGRQPGSVEFELIFDTTDTGKSVTDYTNLLLDQMELDLSVPGSTDTDPRPPTVTFHWGPLNSFRGVIKAATVAFEYFASDGTPLRARSTVKLEQYERENKTEKTNPTSGTPLPHRMHRVQRGETLDRISARYYGDSTQWRVLAAANGIEDPLGIRPGTMISVPKLGS